MPEIQVSFLQSLFVWSGFQRGLSVGGENNHRQARLRYIVLTNNE